MGEDLVSGTGELQSFLEEAIAAMQAIVAPIREKNYEKWNIASRSVGDDCALLHEEVTEILREFREGRMESLYENRHPMFGVSYQKSSTNEEMTPLKPAGFGAECADLLARLVEMCDRRGVNLAYEFLRVMEYNAQRNYNRKM